MIPRQSLSVSERILQIYNNGRFVELPMTYGGHMTRFQWHMTNVHDSYVCIAIS